MPLLSRRLNLYWASLAPCMVCQELSIVISRITPHCLRSCVYSDCYIILPRTSVLIELNKDANTLFVWQLLSYYKKGETSLSKSRVVREAPREVGLEAET